MSGDRRRWNRAEGSGGRDGHSPSMAQVEEFSRFCLRRLAASGIRDGDGSQGDRLAGAMT